MHLYSAAAQDATHDGAADDHEPEQPEDGDQREGHPPRLVGDLVAQPLPAGQGEEEDAELGFLTAQLAGLREALASGDGAALEAAFESARTARRAWAEGKLV